MSLIFSNFPPQGKQRFRRKNLLMGRWKFKSLPQIENWETAVEKCDFSFGSSEQISQCVVKHFSQRREGVLPLPTRKCSRTLCSSAAQFGETRWGSRSDLHGMGRQDASSWD